MEPEVLLEEQRFRARLVLNMIIIAAAVSLLIAFFIKENLKRTEYDREKKKAAAQGKNEEQ